MSEARLASLALGVWFGAMVAWPVPLAPALLALGLALLLRKELTMVAACAALASALGARAELAYQPVVVAAYDGTVQLVTDVERWPFGARFEGRLDDGRRVRVSVDGAVASVVDRASVGTTFSVTGRLRPFEEQPWLRARHLVGDLSVSSATLRSGPPWWQQPSEFLRRLVGDGARAFEPEAAALYNGLVIGDDRAQSLAQRSRFRRAGLSHLLAVSGQNVAFALAVLWPLARRFEMAGRVGLIGVALAVFALATRLEPSVVRATATAGIGVAGMLLGRPATGTRVLCLTVAGLVLVDPFLVWSVGFRLSVAATAGILLLGPILLQHVPGPRPVAGAVAITVSAQVFVVPMLVSTFGPVSLVSLPANLLAGWAAGVVMVWGLSIGLAAGQVWGGEWLQWPVAWLLAWLDGVATWAARVPAPEVGGSGFVVLLAGLAGSWLWRGRRSGAMGWSVPVLIIALALVVFGPRSAEPSALDGAQFFPASEGSFSVLVVEAGAGSRLVDALVADRVQADVVVFTRAGRSARVVAAAVVEVTGPGLVLVPPQHSVVGGRRVTDTTRLTIGETVLVLTPERSTLIVSQDD